MRGAFVVTSEALRSLRWIPHFPTFPIETAAQEGEQPILGTLRLPNEIQMMVRQYLFHATFPDHGEKPKGVVWCSVLTCLIKRETSSNRDRFRRSARALRTRADICVSDTTLITPNDKCGIQKSRIRGRPSPNGGGPNVSSTDDVHRSTQFASGHAFPHASVHPMRILEQRLCLFSSTLLCFSHLSPIGLQPSTTQPSH